MAQKCLFKNPYLSNPNFNSHKQQMEEQDPLFYICNPEKIKGSDHPNKK